MTTLRNFEVAAADMTADQERLVNKITNGPRGRMTMPLRVWVNNPKLLEALEPGGLHLTKNISLTERQKEVAILVCAHYWDAKYEQYAHRKSAGAAGVPEAAIDAILAGREPTLTDPLEDVVFRIAKAFYRRETLPQPLYDEAQAKLGVVRFTDLICLLGYYTMVSFTLNAYDVPAPA